MSTDFVTDKPIPFDKLQVFDHLGFKFDSIDERTIILTDGENYMYADNNPEFDPFISGDEDLHIRYIPLKYQRHRGFRKQVLFVGAVFGEMFYHQLSEFLGSIGRRFHCIDQGCPEPPLFECVNPSNSSSTR